MVWNIHNQQNITVVCGTTSSRRYRYHEKIEENHSLDSNTMRIAKNSCADNASSHMNDWTTFYPYERCILWIYVISCGRQSGRLVRQKLYVGHYAQTFQPNSFIHAIDFYHSMQLSVTLTLAWDHEVSGKQNHLASFPRTLFNWYNGEAIQVEQLHNTFEWDLMNQGKYFLFYWLRSKLKQWYVCGRLWTDLVQTWHDDRYY